MDAVLCLAFIEGRNIYEIFEHNNAYEIRLQKAMEEDLLCPFHYFGITDFEIIDDEMSWCLLPEAVPVDIIICISFLSHDVSPLQLNIRLV